MKIYDFTSRERELGRIVFALTLIKTRKRLAERIIIGRENEVRLILNGNDGEVYYDETRPFGSLLFDFESDANGDWNKHISTLTESYGLKYSFGSARWDKAAPVSEFLTAKYKSGEPSSVFAAVRTWDEYLNLYNQNSAATQTLNSRLFMLYKPFLDYAKYKPWHENAVDALTIAMRHGESQVELSYSVAKRTFETAIVFSSLLPIISYYLNKMNDWKLVFQQCKVCGKDFAAPSRHYALCSDKCRKQNAKIAKHKYNERIKDDEIESKYNTAYHYWSNRWRKAQKVQDINSDAAIFKAAFDNFRAEAVEHKKNAKTAIKAEKRKDQKRADKEKAVRKIISEFNNWLIKQRGEADRLMEEITQKRHGE